MLRPTVCLQGPLRRLPLSPKQAGKEYYKGNRVGSMGTIDKYGRFHPDYSKIRTYVFPTKGTKGFELTPFVSMRAPKAIETDESKWAAPAKRITGEEYLQRWKSDGGHDVVDVPMEAGEQSGRNMPEVWEEPVKKK